VTENSNDLKSFEDRLVKIFNRKKIPEQEDFLVKVGKASKILDSEDKTYRPQSPDGRPGGLIHLRHIPTIIIPDLHARMDLFLHIMFFNLQTGGTVLQGLSDGSVQVVCVGDGFHAEARAINRWRKALEEYGTSYDEHSSMDKEMSESLGLMEMVMELKSRFPSLFHFLKGNHENIANEHGGGNYPFRKFVYEGEMVTFYIKKFYGNEFLSQYYAFEKRLPVLAAGKNFLVCHAEPKSFYPREMVVDYHSYSDVIYGLTWTANDEAQDGSVVKMLKHYLGAGYTENTFIFGGHRPVSGLYNLRAEARYVQIHNPDKYIIAWLKGGEIDLERDVIEIPPNKKLVHGK
jgi:hypothetical protein